MSKRRTPVAVQDRFEVFHRDDFTCLYCGERPGNSGLHVDHLLPKSLGGSDVVENLATACSRCNRGKSNAIYMPNCLVSGKDDGGWWIHKTWGIWSIKFCTTDMAVCGAIATGDPCKENGEYTIGIVRVHEPDWPSHINQKTWPDPHCFFDFLDCLAYARLLYQPEVCDG